jgi:hypothetical protein
VQKVTHLICKLITIKINILTRKALDSRLYLFFGKILKDLKLLVGGIAINFNFFKKLASFFCGLTYF